MRLYKPSDVIVRSSTVENNVGHGVLVIGSVGGAIVGNRISGNAFQGLGSAKGR